MNPTALIPWWGRLLALLALIAALIGFGWVKGAGHVQSEWDAAKAVQSTAVAKQTAHVAAVTVAQSSVNQGVKDATDARIAAVHAAYGGVRRPSSGGGAVPQVSGGAGQPSAEAADPGPAAGDGLHQESYRSLAERCAVTTAIGLGWQEWYDRQAEAFTGGNHGESDSDRGVPGPAD